MDRTCRVSSSFRERDCIWGSFCSHDFCRMFCCKSSTTKRLPTRIQKFKTYKISKCKCQGHSWFGCPNSWEGLVELLLWPKPLDCKTRTWKSPGVKTSKTKDPCKTTFFRGTKKVMTMKKNYYLDSLDCLDNGQLKNMESNNSF